MKWCVQGSLSPAPILMSPRHTVELIPTLGALSPEAGLQGFACVCWSLWRVYWS